MCAVCAVRCVLVESGQTSTRSVNAAQSPPSSTIGSTWASWPCYRWCCTGSSSSGTPERRGGRLNSTWSVWFKHVSSWCVCDEDPLCVALCRRVFSSSALLQHITAMLECSVSAVVTLLVTEPVGLLSIRSCRVQMLSDWYTMLYNPSPDYINTLHCTQEAVYPL